MHEISIMNKGSDEWVKMEKLDSNFLFWLTNSE